MRSYINNLTLITWSFSCIVLKFVMHVTTKQFSDMFDNDWKKFKMADLL